MAVTEDGGAAQPARTETSDALNNKFFKEHLDKDKEIAQKCRGFKGIFGSQQHDSFVMPGWINPAHDRWGISRNL